MRPNLVSECKYKLDFKTHKQIVQNKLKYFA
jgi:hypothetical protein